MLITILVIINLLLTIALIAFGVYIYVNITTIFNTSSYIRKMGEINTEDIIALKDRVETLEKSPAEFTKRFSIIDFRLKKFEDIIQTFNHGFTPRQSYMSQDVF